MYLFRVVEAPQVHPKAKIPRELWEQVIRLFDYYPLTKIRKTLKLDSAQIKYRFKEYRNIKNSAKIPGTNQRPTFIPINIHQPNIEIEPNSNSIGKVEIKRPDGATIFIEHLNQKTLSTLLTQFMQGL